MAFRYNHQIDVATHEVRPTPPPPPPPGSLRDRVLTPAGVALLGLALGVTQFYAKPRPDPSDIARFADTFTRSEQWTDRIAPDFETTLLDGRRFQLADHVGSRVVILNFFATWCAPCKAEMPELERYQKAQGDGVILVGIDAQENRTLVETFVREVGVSFPVAIDDDGALIARFGVTAYPTTVVIGADGRVKLYETGAISNADVTFAATVTRERRAIDAGEGVTRDAYLAAVAAAPALPDAPDSAPALSARAQRIAQLMPCPCGCDDMVTACDCKTAKGIKARLAADDFGNLTDAQIMEALNKEFCMKGM